ncbi:MAG: SIMPL domain-containing protein [Bryobacteraceae bacterium]
MRTALLALWACAPLVAQQAKPNPFPSTVRASAEAVVWAAPDRARIHIGVVTQAATAQEAGTGNARQLETALAELRKVLGPGADIKTISYSLSPNHRYPREGGPPAIAGYTATNTVQVTTDDLSAAGKIIDTATQGGANTIQSLEFTLKNDRKARAQALGEATAQARVNAEIMAAAVGMRVVRIVSVEQGEPSRVRPLMAAPMAMEARVTPVSPGAIEVRATATLTAAVQ